MQSVTPPAFPGREASSVIRKLLMTARSLPNLNRGQGLCTAMLSHIPQMGYVRNLLILFQDQLRQQRGELVLARHADLGEHALQDGARRLLRDAQLLGRLAQREA